MTITSVITENKENTATTISVTEEHTDSITGISFRFSYVADNGFDTASRLASNANIVQVTFEQQEIDDAIQTFIDGGDPLHTGPEPNGPFTQVVPVYLATWDDLATPVTMHFLEDLDRNFLRYIEKTIIRISSNDKRRIWDTTNPKVNDVNSEIQNAVNAQVELDGYSPLAVEGVIQ